MDYPLRIKILAFVCLPSCGEKLNAQLKTIATGGVPCMHRGKYRGAVHVGNLIELICAHAKEFSSG